MPRCGKCGRNNPPTAAFCQDCGSRLETVDRTAEGEVFGVVSTSPVPGGSAELRCSACGTLNPSQMAFCRQCGTRLEREDGSGPKPMIGCPRCSRDTPAGFNFCQHCGYRLIGEQGAPVQASPTPPFGMPVSTATPPSRAPVSRVNTPERGGTSGVVPAPVGMARSPVPTAPPEAGPLALPVPAFPAQPVSGGARVRSGVGKETPMGLPDSVAGTIADDASGPGRFPGAPVAAQSPVRLVSVNRDGSDGVVFPVTGEHFDIGRRTGTLLFEDDGYLSERHARLELRQGRYYLVDLETLNGIFVRIRHKEELRDGIQILLGMQLLSFDLIPEQERDPAPAVQHGVLVFGTPPKLPWARLTQWTTAGIVRDVYHLYRAEVVIGRDSGDIVFSDDDFMSRMHAAIRNEGGKAWLVDLNSSNGTYIQVDHERPLSSGDFLRLGDQLLRFEEA